MPTQTTKRQFTIRSLLGMTLLVAVILGSGCWWVRSSQAQQRAIDAIARKGGLVWFDRAERCIDIELGVSRMQGCGQTVLLAGPTGKGLSFNDGDLSLIDQIWRVRSVRFGSAVVSSEAVEQFQSAHPRVHIAK